MLIALIEKGLALEKRLGSAAVIGDTTRMLGQVLFYAGEIKRGIGLLHESYEILKKSGDLVRLAHAAGSLSRHYALLSDGKSARQWGEEALDASKQMGSFRLQVMSGLELAWACILRGDVPGALSILETAQQMARRGGIEEAEIPGHAASVPTIIHLFLSEWDKAETELLKLKQSPALPRVWHRTALGGRLYLERGELGTARQRLLEGLSLLEDRGYKTDPLVLHALLSQVASMESKSEEAERYLHKAQEILSNGEDWRGLAGNVYFAEGILASAEKNWQEAEAAFKKALDINRQYEFPYYEAKCLFEWGQMYLGRNDSGDRERGMKLLDEALAIFQRIQAKKMVEKVLGRKQVLTA